MTQPVEQRLQQKQIADAYERDGEDRQDCDSVVRTVLCQVLADITAQARKQQESGEGDRYGIDGVVQKTDEFLYKGDLDKEERHADAEEVVEDTPATGTTVRSPCTARDDAQREQYQQGAEQCGDH